ncbi:MAG: carbohydrate ABC transporter permease [bacterium]
MAKMSKLRMRENLEGYLFAMPWMIGFVVFVAGPILASLVLSFCEYDIVSTMKWTGLKNYYKLFTGDRLFWISLYNTAYYSFFSIPLGIAGGLVIALLMNQNVRALGLLRTIYYLPAVTSGVAVSILWIWILDPSVGLINYLLDKIGIVGPLWLQDPKWSKPALIIMSLWGVGGSMVIYLAGLQGIPTELYEAAAIDGANAWQKFWHVTIPMMTPVILFNLIMGIIGSFQVFTQAYIMTSGGPLNSTLFYVYYLYKVGFEGLHMGYASSMAWILFVVILALSLLAFKSSSAWVYYEASMKGR